MRSTRRDGFRNRAEFYLTTHFPGLWRLVQRVPPLRCLVNRILINRAILKMPTRPNPLSTMADYTSWPSLTDRTFDARHLPPAEVQPFPSDVERVVELFRRKDGTRLCPKSTVLFPYFAEWFTDGFLRSDRSESRDLRRNESNHEIDLMQLYGLTSAQTQDLRSGQNGRLKSQIINGEEFPPYLCQDGEIKPEFSSLRVVHFKQLSDAQKSTLFAMGSDTSNFQLGFVLMNVLFLREHNRVAGRLAQQYPTWSGDRLFETTRNILTVLLIKIVIEEYINHLTPYYFQFQADPKAFTNKRWYRTNWMAIEFNLLYRWHSAVPSRLRIDGQEYTIAKTLWPGELVTRRGLGPHFEDASRQPAAQIGVFNTDDSPLQVERESTFSLLDVERESIDQARVVELATYNDYRAYCGFPRVTRFNQISGDSGVQSALRDVYGHVDRIEFYVGLFAEDPRPNSVLPSLMGRMVAVDAFSQALTNPLLAPRVFNEETFSPLGMELIRTTRKLSDLVERNVPPGSQPSRVSMTREDWQRV